MAQLSPARSSRRFELPRAPRVPVSAEAELTLGGLELEVDRAFEESLAGGWFDDGAGLGDGQGGAEVEVLPLSGDTEACDVSLSGLRLRNTSGIDITPGDTVQLRIDIPGDDAGRILVNGIVVRVDGDFAAVRYTWMHSDDRARLEAWVGCFVGDPKPPARGFRALLNFLHR